MTIEDEAPITPELKLEPSENREDLDDTEILESLSNLFGKLDIDQGTTNQLITTTKNQKNLTNLTDKSEEEIYIQASITQNLLPVEEPDNKPKEFLLSSKTLQCLRSDLESLEEIEVDELMDYLGQTQLQSGEGQNECLTENTSELFEKSLVMTSEAELTNLEDLFVNVNDVSEKLIASNQKNISSLAENTENELTIEDILDDLTPETDEEIIETDNQELLSLEALLQD